MRLVESVMRLVESVRGGMFVYMVCVQLLLLLCVCGVCVWGVCVGCVCVGCVWRGVCVCVFVAVCVFCVFV